MKRKYLAMVAVRDQSNIRDEIKEQFDIGLLSCRAVWPLDTNVSEEQTYFFRAEISYKLREDEIWRLLITIQLVIF
jgi:hypothetical protein